MPAAWYRDYLEAVVQRDVRDLARISALDALPRLLSLGAAQTGSWTFSTVGQGDCARFIADRGIDVDHLFTERWKLHQAEEAYRLFDSQTTGKGVILLT